MWSASKICLILKLDSRGSTAFPGHVSHRQCFSHLKIRAAITASIHTHTHTNIQNLTWKIYRISIFYDAPSKAEYCSTLLLSTEKILDKELEASAKYLLTMNWRKYGDVEVELCVLMETVDEIVATRGRYYSCNTRSYIGSRFKGNTS